MIHGDLVSLLHPAGPNEQIRVISEPAGSVSPGEDVVYVDAPLRRRRAIVRRLKKEGLRPAATFVHLEAGELLVQLDRPALVYATQSLLSAPRWMRVAAAAAVGPVRVAAAALMPRVGIACRRDGAQALAAWLGDGGPDASRGIVLRAAHGHRFAYLVGASPRFAKLESDERERSSLELRAPVAARAGAAVPRLLAAPGNALVTTLVEGRPASSALRDGAAAPEDVVRAVAAWLMSWNGLTATGALVTRELLEAEIFSRLDVLEDRPQYRSWLVRRGEKWLSAQLPRVTAHLDLTMANVLVGQSGRIAVVDWAEARDDALPLVDLYYAAADAAAAVDSYMDRAQPFRDGRYARLVADAEAALAAALEISDDLRELCFHACWLHHAANELQKGGGDGSFARIVDYVAREATGG